MTEALMLDLSDPSAEQPSITMPDGRTLTVLTFGTMPYVHRMQARRMIHRKSILEIQINAMIEAAIPTDLEVLSEEFDEVLAEAIQADIIDISQKATRLICPELTDDDMAGLSGEVQERLHARFLYSSTQFVTQLNQDMGRSQVDTSD